ncbi:GNAT family N-acetyltransferase [Clostridium sulfidigenes]|uniref:GNAT family N-acetyltransferase n=1 Tax=Clostridium sulfidigenes TaxID=318464 RepID=UPI003F8989C4
MEGLKIVEYTPAYAKAIAEMWQRSTEGWNGENGNETEETVLAAHENSTDINTYLAVLGDDVLGYCAFSRYVKDEGALHIRRLNARYDCHGKGIGKALVLKSVERTIELNWPRLDIYTWSANTKAIPLYKKCGYFFENREDKVHLMNFIPTVMHTEAVEDYFKDAHWYNDMKRIIDMEPDGRMENGFEFYEYLWEKNNKNLRMEFERWGRGLRLIETDDYKISLYSDSHSVIFGRSYRAFFEIVNKTGRTLNVEIKGRDDKEVKFLLDKNVQVADKTIIQGGFYLSEIQEEYGDYKTHPAVVADVAVNGRKALFKLGIVPKFPGKINFLCMDRERYSGETFNMDINVESYLDEQGIFEFTLPESNDVEFSAREFKIRIDKTQKIIIPVQCRLKNPCIYEAGLQVNVKLSSGESVQFKNNVAVVFMGRNHGFGGEVDGKYVIVNGIYKLTLDKNYNRVETFVGEEKKNTFIDYPKLGLPFSQEFSNMVIKNVKWYFEDEKMVLSGKYISNDYKGLAVRTIFKICSNGIFEHSYEITNTSVEETPKDIYLDQNFHYRIEGALIPYNNSILHATESRMEYPGYYDSEKIDGNWIFSSKEESIVWPKNLKADFDGWYMHIQHNLGRLKGGEKRVTDPVYMAFSTFKNWHEVRRFALKSNEVRDIPLAEDFQVDISNNSLFVRENFDINITENRNISYTGEITVTSKNNFFDNVHINIGEGTNKINIQGKAESGFEYDLINVNCNFSDISYERKIPVFYIKNVECKSQITEEKGIKVYSMSNGVMNIKACPKFTMGLFSLEYMGRQWLDSSFPEAGPKSWYNPWFGGIENIPKDMLENARSLAKETTEASLVERTDILGNTWMGIKTTMTMACSNDYNGLEINQYFLMLPGVPVLLNAVELVNNMDRYMVDEGFMNSAFLKLGDDIKKSWVSVKNHGNTIDKYKAGLRDYEIYPYSSPLYGCDDLQYKIQVNMDFDKYTQQEYINTKDISCLNLTKVTMAPGERKALPYVFYIFTKEHISDNLLKNLHNVKF